MKKRISRRDFFHIAAASIPVAASLSPKVQRIVTEPFLRPPEEVLSGQATWYASTCRQCPAGCGIIVRTVNGRAKKIEGNPLHPLNRGKLCARGQAGLQVLYDPDRLRNAVRRSGDRGSRQFEPLYWSEALDLLAQQLSSVSSPDRVAFLGGLMPDHQYLVAARLLEALGAPPPFLFDLHSALEGRAAAQHNSQTMFGDPDLPIYDVARSEVIFSFGANFLETWMSPVAQMHAYGTMRQGQFGGRGFFVQFEPRLSTTAASADEWVPLRPGTEGFVALAVGRIIVEENLGHVGSHREHAVMYQDVDIAEMAAAAEIPVEKLRQLAQVFADADQAIAIPGGYLAGQSNGSASMMAVQALNILVAQLGRVGGVFMSNPGPTATLRQRPEIDSFNRVSGLIDQMKAGNVEVLLIHSANPLYELPSVVGFQDALANVPYVVSFSSFVDDTSVRADLILPDHTYLESWGYQVPMPGADRPVVSSQQPVVQPLYDTRASVDVFLALADRLGGAVAEALPWADESAFLQEVSGSLHNNSLSAYDTQTQGGFWALWRQYGGWWSEKEIPVEPQLTAIIQEPLPIRAPQFEGEENTFPFHLYPYPSVSLSAGTGAQQAWLQETPDPMTTVSWGTWVELNPETARRLGVTDDDVVRVISSNGEVEAPVVVFPGIRPDIVAIPVGQGHSDYGRFAKERGANPMTLVAPVTDQDSGSLAWAATRVRIEPTGRSKVLARLESLDGEGRESLG